MIAKVISAMLSMLLWNSNPPVDDAWVAHEILETAQSPNSSFPFLFDFGHVNTFNIYWLMEALTWSRSLE